MSARTGDSVARWLGGSDDHHAGGRTTEPPKLASDPIHGTTGYVDLHTHTTYSDGLLSPGELVKLASDLGLAAIAITDHDSVDGLAEATRAGDALGVEVISGVELSSSGSHSEIHVLGYLLDADSRALRAALERFRRHRYERAERMVGRLNQQGIPLRMTQVVEAAATKAVGRPHLAEALVSNGFVASFDEAFRRYLKRGGAAFVAKPSLSPLEAIDVIHQAGGLAVVAHPTHGPTERELRAMVEAGLDGIEVRHPLLGPNDTKRFTRLVNHYKLVATGGSDFHGPGRSGRALGDERVSRSAVEALRSRQRALAVVAVVAE